MKIIKTLVTLLLLLLLSSCAMFFQPKVSMSFDSTDSSLEDLLIEPVKGGKLQTPSWIDISKNVFTSKIFIRWEKVPNAISYRIEFAAISPDKDGLFPENISEEQYSIVEEYWIDDFYSHEITENTISDYENRYKKRYYYRVTAINVREDYEDSNPTSSNVYGTIFAPPEKISATGGDFEDCIKLTWDLVDGARSYDIYKTESSNGSGAAKIDSVFGNINYYSDSITNTKEKGKDLFYFVKAVNNSGVESERSAVTMGYTRVEGAPATPTNVDITEGRGVASNKIKLSWKASTDPNVYYNVYRCTNTNSSLTLVNQKGLIESEFEDTISLDPGIYYIYKIQSYVIKEEAGKKETLKSAFSAPVEGFVLSAPDELVAKKVTGGVQLSWNKAIGNDNEQKSYSYKIFASNDIDGEFIEKGTTNNTEITLATYSFYKLKTVRMVNGVEITSDFSKAVAPAPDAVNSVSVSRHDYSFLGENQKAGDYGVYPVKISWEKPSTDSPYGYYVYRSSNEESGFRRISDKVILEKSGTDSYYIDIDPTLRPGKVYYYKVLSLNSLENGENFSSAKYGWGALTHEVFLKEYNKTIVSSQKKLTLMHKPGSTDKLGSETANGTISGSLSYNAKVVGLGAEIQMRYSNYADFYIKGITEQIPYFVLDGNSDTSANMQSNGNMHGEVKCLDIGMYPGIVDYNDIIISAGAAGGGTYGVLPLGYNKKQVSFKVLEE